MNVGVSGSVTEFEAGVLWLACYITYQERKKGRNWISTCRKADTKNMWLIFRRNLYLLQNHVAEILTLPPYMRTEKTDLTSSAPPHHYKGRNMKYMFWYISQQ
jgi:hypothetical protein